MRSVKVVDYFVSKVPPENIRWCEAKHGCCCVGCINNSTDITKEEWESWAKRHNYCGCCGRYDPNVVIEGLPEGSPAPMEGSGS